MLDRTARCASAGSRNGQEQLATGDDRRRSGTARPHPFGLLCAARLTSKRLGRALAAPMLVLMGACAVGPDFVPPPAPAAATWLEWRSKSLKTGDYEYRDWWRVF